MGRKYKDKSWDYKNENTKSFTHCYHNYPAMMIPQVARRILKKYSNGEGTLFDPYCGTGTSLVEASLLNMDAIGTDLNPLARLIAETKTCEIDITLLDSTLKRFEREIVNQGKQSELLKRVKTPNFKNIDYWFSPEVKKKLQVIKNFIKGIENNEQRKFFLVSFSETIRDVSYTRNSEFKLYRIPENKMHEFKPDVFSVMQSKLSRNRLGLIEYNKVRNNLSGTKSTTKILDFNTVEGIPKKLFYPTSISIVLTSPPYGDSRTTVAYGQFSRLSSQWLGYNEIEGLDSKLMGGNIMGDSFSFNLPILDSLIRKIKRKDEKRAMDVTSFFKDYLASITNISGIIKKGGFACYVVGNRTVKGYRIPTDEITKDFFISNNFEHVETIIRSIPSKRMPKENSPSNVKGEKSSTMNNEYIVICKKL